MNTTSLKLFQGIGRYGVLLALVALILFGWLRYENFLGTFNVLSVIRAALDQNIPHVYLGFFVKGCRSLEYKARFRPNQALHSDGDWRLFAD